MNNLELKITTISCYSAVPVKIALLDTYNPFF